MFCPKCGLQNADESKFCRGCGANLSNVLAAVDGKPRPASRSLAEKQLALYSRGIRGLLGGAGFLIIAWLLYTLAPQIMFLQFFSLAFAFVSIATGISRLVHARGIRRLREGDDAAALPPGQTEYIKPWQSIYETDDLARQPLSVTEHTTHHLEIDKE